MTCLSLHLIYLIDSDYSIEENLVNRVMNSEQNQQQNFSLQICATLGISIERESISKAIYIDADQEH